MQIQNVVASVNLERKLSLEKLLESLDKSEYQPDTFPGLVYRINNPSATFLIFQTGKIICIGSKTIAQAKQAVGELVKIFRGLGMKMPKEYKINVENIVVTDTLGEKINVDELVFSLPESEYTPDTFPGVVYRITDPKVSFLIFGSGKIVCAGAKTIADSKKAVDILRKKLKSIGVL
ncbi:MAG: TATA-box-binding protein [Candidatus Aenigmarchaeota archaeon]|nr:TATA-box-binding protein [Candidatus Aenigmarchaeota archaeon]